MCWQAQPLAVIREQGRKNWFKYYPWMLVLIVLSTIAGCLSLGSQFQASPQIKTVPRISQYGHSSIVVISFPGLRRQDQKRDSRPRSCLASLG